MIHLFGKKGYIFTNKKTPKWGIMSTILGIISILSVCVAVYLTYKNKGSALPQYGSVIVLSIIYSIAGLALGIRSCFGKDVFRFFPIMGIIFNAWGLLLEFFILYMGIFRL